MRTPLPTRCDAAVIGGGLAGLGCALFLAEGGIDVVLLEARDEVLSGATGLGPGLSTVGMLDEPDRLILAIGLEDAREVYRFCLENRALVEALVPVSGEGTLHAALGEAESAALHRTVEALDALGVEAALWEPDRVNAALSSAGFGRGRWVPGDRRVDPAAARAALVSRIEAAGGTIVTGARVDAVQDAPPDEDGLSLQIGAEALQAEICVYAAGAATPSLDPYFEQRIIPVRGQCLETAPVGVALPGPVRSQQGYLYAAQSAGGGLIVGGARWATPHLEVGETDASVVVERVHEKLEAFARGRWPALAEVEVARRWSRIMDFTCDGLPFIGPIPGDCRRIACAGFNGRPWGMALRAARAVADGLLEGRTPGLPRFFQPSRML